mmetsp:Transcript_47944/g.102783  ORF Transcript_47944/g.102783 Transcript_47944/m.102783 type:complete len:422 (+) Transcript_47944:3-1268(+)
MSLFGWVRLEAMVTPAPRSCTATFGTLPLSASLGSCRTVVTGWSRSSRRRPAALAGDAKTAASLGVVAAIAVAVRHGGRPRSLLRLRRPAQHLVTAETCIALAEEKHRFVEGEWINKMVCPVCNGGDKREHSFSVIVEHGYVSYKCWRLNKCDAHGRIRHSLYFAPRACVAPPQPRAKNLGGGEPLSGELLEYMVKDRKIPESVLRRNGVVQKKSFCPSESREMLAITFLYRAGGTVVAEKYRALPKIFWQAKGGEDVLYGVDDLRGQDTVILVEGEIDKLSVEAAGLKGVASLKNGAAGSLPLSFGAKQALQAAQKIVLAFDIDAAGQKAAENIFLSLSALGTKCYRAVWRSGCKDANEVLLEHGPAAVCEDIGGAELMESRCRCQPRRRPTLPQFQSLRHPHHMKSASDEESIRETCFS